MLRHVYCTKILNVNKCQFSTKGIFSTNWLYLPEAKPFTRILFSVKTEVGYRHHTVKYELLSGINLLKRGIYMFSQV